MPAVPGEKGQHPSQRAHVKPLKRRPTPRICLPPHYRHCADTLKRENGKLAMIQTVKAQRHEDGSPVYTPLTAITLMVFYVFALQCVSTVAVVRRETNSWRWAG